MFRVYNFRPELLSARSAHYRQSHEPTANPNSAERGDLVVCAWATAEEASTEPPPGAVEVTQREAKKSGCCPPVYPSPGPRCLVVLRKS